MGRKKGKFQLFKRGAVWYVRVWDADAGRYVATRSTGETNKTNATIRANQMVDRGEMVTGSDRLVLDYVIERINAVPSKEKYRREGLAMMRTLAGSSPDFARLRLGEIRSKHINRLVDYLEEQGRTPRMINRCTQYLTRHLRDAHRSGWIETDPTTPAIRKAVERPARRGALTMDEIKRIADMEPGDDPREWCYFVTAMLTGLRKSELRALVWSDIDPERGIITVRRGYTSMDGLGSTKTAESERVVPVLEPVRRAIEILHNESPYTGPDDYVFFQRDRGRPVPDHWIERKAFTGVLDRAGIGPEERERRNLVPHGLRHTYLTLAGSVLSLARLMQFSGHTRSATADGYMHTSIEQIGEAKMQLENALKKVTES